MREKLVVGNIKMNLLSPLEIERYLAVLEREVHKTALEKTKVVIAPPVVFLERFAAKPLAGVELAAQNIFWEYSGAFTGEVSAQMVKSAGAKFAIVGHSERRGYFGETDEIANAKIKAALKVGLLPILCVGESAGERKSNQTAGVLRKQISGALVDVTKVKMENVVIAYEPVWAVGSDVVPSSDEIMEAKIIIRKYLSELFDPKTAEKTRILYGGSVNPRIASAVCVDPGMDGALVGRDSLDAHNLVKIAEALAK